MTCPAIAAELILMWFLVAESAVAAQPEKGSIKIFDFDLRTGAGRDVGCCMAFFAFQLAMPSFQDKASLRAMVETSLIWRDQEVFRATVFHMAVRTVSRGSLICSRVIALSCFYSSPDLHMTVEAFQTLAQKAVAGCTSGYTVQIRMTLR